MNLRLSALLSIKSDGTQKIANETGKIAQNLDKAQKSANKMSAVGAGGLSRSGGIPHGDGDGLDRRSHAVARGVAGSRGAAGRDFAGLAQLGGETNGLVAAYATLAANIFALTAAFKALSDAAKFVQLQKGLETVGAQSGRTLSIVAKGMQEISGYAISSVEAMKAVASATAAGFNGEEIERLTRVAKGASVALGRDMSDSIDRLTRGTIKLEPELLDELGIMTRIDEAVRAYALEHKLAASSLTNTQRRQAFLNAVLAEGEKKFGSIADAVDVSAYDKLSAAVRESGTQFLAFTNTILGPFVDTLIKVPALALIPLAGMLQSAFGKLIPDTDKFLGQAEQRVQRADGLLKRAKNRQQTYLNDQADVASSWTPANAGMLRAIAGREIEETDPRSWKAVIKETELHIASLEKAKASEANLSSRTREQEITLTKEVLRLAKEELAIAERKAKFDRANASIEVAQRRDEAYRANAVAFSNDLLDSHGSMLGTVKAATSAVARDLKTSWNEWGKAAQSQNAAIAESGKKLVPIYSSVGARISNLGVLFSGFGRAAETALQGIQASMGAIFIVIGLISLALSAFSWVEETFLGNTKEVKKAKEELGAVQETSAKTAKEIEKFRAFGDFGRAIDAATNSMQELLEKTEALRMAQEAANPKTIAQKAIKDIQDQDRGLRLKIPFTFEFSEETDKYMTSVGNLMAGYSEDAQNKFAESVKNIGLDEDKQIENMNKIVKTLTPMSGAFQDARESAKGLGDEINKLRTPDIFQTPYAKVADGFKQIQSSMNLVYDVYDKLGWNKAEARAGFADALLANPAALSEIGIVNGTYEAILSKQNEIKALKVQELGIAKNLTLSEQEREKQISDLVLKATALKNELMDLIPPSAIIAVEMKNMDAVLATAALKVLQMKKNLEELKATSMKTSFSMDKISRDIGLLQRVGSTDIGPGGAAAEEVRSAQESYKIAVATSKIRMQVVRAEAALADKQLRYQLEMQKIAMHEKFGEVSVLQVTELRAYAKKHKIKPLFASEQERLLNMYLEAQDMLTSTANETNAITAQSIANMQQELDLLDAQVDLATAKGIAVYKEINQQKSLLDFNKKRLDAERERFELQKSISELALTGQELSVKEQAYRERRNVTPAEQLKLEKEKLKLAIENATFEKTLLEKEFKLKAKNNALETQINLLKLKESQAAWQKIADESKDPKTKATYQGLADEAGKLTKTAITQAWQSIGDFSSILDLQNQKLDATLTNLRAQFDALKDPLAAMLAKIETQMNEDQKAFNRSGGNNNWLAAFSPKAAARSREIAKDPASEGLTAAQIQGLAVQQELFNLQLSATDQILGTIASSFGEMFSGLIDGTVKAKDAFKQFALSVLKMIAQIATEMLILQTLQMILPKGPNIGPGPMGQTLLKGNAATAFSNDLSAASFLSGAAGGIIPMATGGIMDRSMGLQGVITKPTYLVGEGKYNEAVVPLPNGRSIPVQLHSAPNNKNNVQVNVNITDSGTTVDKSGEGMNDLGARIAMAVQKELLAQKAPGGILNKYGVA